MPSTFVKFRTTAPRSFTAGGRENEVYVIRKEKHITLRKTAKPTGSHLSLGIIELAKRKQGVTAVWLSYPGKKQIIGIVPKSFVKKGYPRRHSCGG